MMPASRNRLRALSPSPAVARTSSGHRQETAVLRASIGDEGKFAKHAPHLLDPSRAQTRCAPERISKAPGGNRGVPVPLTDRASDGPGRVCGAVM